MFRFYNTTKTCGSGQAPPQRRPWRGQLSLFMLMFLLIPALSFAQSSMSKAHVYNNGNNNSGSNWSHSNSNGGYYYYNNVGSSGTSTLNLTNFGFAIPSTATIVGIEVTFSREKNGGSSSRTLMDATVALRYGSAGGTTVSTNHAKASSDLWPTSFAPATYGSSSDTWFSGGITPSQINNSNFGLQISVNRGGSGSSSPDARIQEPTITVYYTNALDTLYVTSGSLAATKVYDGSLNVTPTGAPALSVAHAGVNLDASGAVYNYVNVSASNSVGVVGSGFILTGVNAANYYLVDSVAFDGVISKKHLSLGVAHSLATTKQYDGTMNVNNADVTGGGYSLSGVVTGDDVTIDTSNLAYVYASKNVANPNEVTGSGYVLAGTDIDNYTFNEDTTVTFDGVITKKAATITATNQTKCYNTAFTGVADSVHFTDTGFVAGEGVATVDLTSTGSGSMATAGNYPIVPSNAVANSATDLNNYTITYVNGVLKALPKLAVYINTVANQEVCAGNSISLNYTLEGPGVLSADLLISKVDGLITPFDTFHIDNKIAGSSQSVTIPVSYTPNTGNTDVKYRLTWLNVTSDSINCDGITNGQVDVTIHPAPALVVSYTDTTLCSGSDWTVGLSNPNAVSGATYKIVANYGAASGNIPTAGVTNGFSVSNYTDHVVNNTNAPVVVTYTITTKSPAPNNCDGNYEIVSITVNPNPVLATVVADSVCEGNITTITLNGLNPNMDYDIEGTINGNFDNNGTSGAFSFPGMTGSFTADASGNHSFSYPTVYGDSVVTDYTAQVTKLTYSATGCSIDYTDSNKIGTGVVHPLPTDHLWIDGMALSNNGMKAVCEGSIVTVSTHGDSMNTYSLYRSDNSTLVVPTGHVGDSAYSFTARLSDDGTYYLHLMSPYGCEVVDTIDLSVNPLPVATLMADGSALNNGDTLVVCEATPVTLELTGTLSTDSYVLLQGTDTTATGHVNDAAFTFPAGLSDAGTYYLHVMNSDGCGVVDTFNLIVNPLPTDVFAINGTTVGTVNVQSGDTVMACATSPMTFTVTGNAADSFVLYRGSTLVYNGHPGAPAHSFSAAAINSGTYYLTMMNAHGCVVADTFVLKVNPLPQAAFVVNGFAAHNDDSLAYCEGTPMALTLTGAATDSYVLLHGTDTVGAGHPNDPTYNFTAALSDAGTYYLYLNNSFGCGTVDTYNLAIHPLPTDVFTVNGFAVDNGDTVTFCENSPVALTLTGNSSDSFALYHGTTLVGAGMSNGPAYNFNASASYDAGTYYMHLISEYGCETVDTIEMVVNPLPTATLTFNTNPLMNGDTAIACVESPVTLELTGNTSDTYVLLHGTDTVATGHPNDPAFPFNAAMSDAGTYYLHLSSVHGCGIVDTFNLNVVAKPAFAWSFNGFPATANDSATAINYCASDSLVLGLNVDSVNMMALAIDGYSFGSAVQGMDTTVAMPLASVPAGIHSIKLTVTNSNGCDSSMTVFINVHGLPSFVASTVTDVHCHGGTDGSFGFTVYNNDSTTANYTFNIINVNGNDTVYTLNVNSLAPTSPIIVAGIQSNLGAGTYQVVVSNSFGCATVDTVVISEPPALSLAMTSQDVTCGAVTPNGKIQVQPTGGVPIMGMYQLTVSGPGYNNAQYAAPGGSVYTINHLSAGVYTLTLADSNGCSISQTDTIMKPSANVVTSVNGPDTVNMNASASVILSATGAALPVTYTYTVNGGTPQTATSSASSADVTLTVPTNTVGTVAYAITSVTDANGAPCSPVLGSATVEVVNQAVVDLVPGVDITNGSLSPQYNTSDITISLYNIGNHASNGTITVFVSKPSTNISLDFSGATGWNVTLAGSFYVLTSTSLSVNGNYGVLQIPGTATLSGAGQVGSKFIKVTIPANSGGDSNNSNNSFTGFVNVNQ